MNKKGLETTTAGVIIGLLVAAILSIILVNLIGKFISPGNNKEEDVSYLYFTKVAKELNEMNIGEIKDLSYLTKEDFALILFDKDINEIKKSNSDRTCPSYFFTDTVNKPVKCRDKNCLCICKSSFETAAHIGRNLGLTINCDSEESRCVEIPLKAEFENACNDFTLYDGNEKLYNLEIKKENSVFKIKYGSSKTL
jgi:hypothetical protein